MLERYDFRIVSFMFCFIFLSIILPKFYNFTILHKDIIYRAIIIKWCIIFLFSNSNQQLFYLQNFIFVVQFGSKKNLTLNKHKEPDLQYCSLNLKRFKLEFSLSTGILYILRVRHWTPRIINYTQIINYFGEFSDSFPK